MYPRTAFKILGIMTLCLMISFLGLYFNKKKSLSTKEIQKQDFVDEKITGKNINKDIEEYTEEEIDFIFNPTKSIKEEQGVIFEKEKEKTKVKEYTDEELDVIFNPSKYSN